MQMKTANALEFLSKPKIGMISLGCAKNLVDAEIMLGSVLQRGMEITSRPENGDVLVINTCAFIDSAKEESIEAILEAHQQRGLNSRGDQKLIVSGCMSQRFAKELRREMPEVDAFIGLDQVSELGKIVEKILGKRSMLNAQRPTPKTDSWPLEIGRSHLGFDSKNGDLDIGFANTRPTYIPDYDTPRFRLTPGHFAYLKIAEGCNHPCSFCIIPRMRGAHRSRTQGDIVQEARQLVAEGVRELNLISQDSTYYGLDLRENHRPNIASPEKFSAAAKSLSANATTLCTLLRELNELPGDFWIRLLYTHPAHWTDELIQTIAQCPKVARYVDMPLQHIHHNMLERMRRETSQQYIIDLIAKIRAGIPGIALRTTFIVGFPGETEACFQSLLDFIRQTRFERLGIFTYSREEGTRAA